MNCDEEKSTFGESIQRTGKGEKPAVDKEWKMASEQALRGGSLSQGRESVKNKIINPAGLLAEPSAVRQAESKVVTRELRPYMERLSLFLEIFKEEI